jgi:NAD(P)-dependent dehydrogenase (short-subunit alcohol dehydrogenase family)
MDIQGRHVVITGGSRGIGAAMAYQFAAQGARVTLVARNVDALSRVATQINGAYVVADLTEDAVVDSLIDNIEKLHG